MNKSFDIIVAKEYETRQDGQTVKKTAWNRVGRAWPSKSGEALNFELYMLPQQRYVIQLTERAERTTDNNSNRPQVKKSEQEVPF